VYLLDTNILSQFVRKQRDPAFFRRLRFYPATDLYTSCVCVMELRVGAKKKQDGGVLWRKIEREILPMFPVLGFGEEEALLAGDVLAHLALAGQPIPVEDVLIAATALVRGFTVVTHDLAHFRRIPDLQVDDWLS
jgi:tRNA(fMet)-specific endonuclease VapC